MDQLRLLRRSVATKSGSEMVQYKYLHFLAPSSNRRFDHISTPGAKAPHSGIFRCHVCGREVVAERGDRSASPSSRRR
jgi:hypothetical protein